MATWTRDGVEQNSTLTYGDLTVTGDITANSIDAPLLTSREFSITGDVVADPIAFDNTGNVALVSSIQENTITGVEVHEASHLTIDQLSVVASTSAGRTLIFGNEDADGLDTVMKFPFNDNSHYLSWQHQGGSINFSSGMIRDDAHAWDKNFFIDTEATPSAIPDFILTSAGEVYLGKGLTLGNSGSDVDVYIQTAATNDADLYISNAAEDNDIKITGLSSADGSVTALNIDMSENGAIVTSSTVNGATPTEMGYLSGVASDIQTQLNNKQPLDAQLTTLAAAPGSTITALSDLTSGEVAILDGATVSTAELNYLTNASSNIQTQIDAKVDHVATSWPFYFNGTTVSQSYFRDADDTSYPFKWDAYDLEDTTTVDNTIEVITDERMSGFAVPYGCTLTKVIWNLYQKTATSGQIRLQVFTGDPTVGTLTLRATELLTSNRTYTTTTQSVSIALTAGEMIYPVVQYVSGTTPIWYGNVTMLIKES